MWYKLNNMKKYAEQFIRKAEVAQLILLQHIYGQTGSHDLVFQGGTALRWCYGGSRFSEDLDFVTAMPIAALERLLHKAIKSAEREMLPHLGPGRMTLSDKSRREGSKKLLVGWQPLSGRDAVTVKLECEPLVYGTRLETQRMVMSALPSVSYLVMAGEFRIPRPNSVMVVESPSEILSDKVRALLERQYLKGRDLFDVWLLRQNRAARLDRTIMERKLNCYTWPFNAVRSTGYFLEPDSEVALIEAIETDLRRFLPPEVLDVHRSAGYRDFIDAVRALCREVQSLGMPVL